MKYKSKKGKSFSQRAIDLMVSSSATDPNPERNGEVSTTLYRRQNFRMNGMSIGKLKDIKKGGET